MKKIITTLVLSLAILLPTTAVFAAPGYGRDVTNCTVWREGSGERLPINCKGADETNRRLYELEVALDSMKSQNSALQNKINSLQSAPATVSTPSAPVYVTQIDQGTVQRVTNLETRMTTVEKAVSYLQETVTSAINSVNNNLKKLLDLLKKI